MYQKYQHFKSSQILYIFLSISLFSKITQSWKSNCELIPTWQDSSELSEVLETVLEYIIHFPIMYSVKIMDSL